MCSSFASRIARLVWPAIFFLTDALGEDTEGEVPRGRRPGFGS
jgi:hypothetical protein